jgi:hypothetical protein
MADVAMAASILVEMMRTPKRSRESSASTPPPRSSKRPKRPSPITIPVRVRSSITPAEMATCVPAHVLSAYPDPRAVVFAS